MPEYGLFSCPPCCSRSHLSSLDESGFKLPRGYNSWLCIVCCAPWLFWLRRMWFHICRSCVAGSRGGRLSSKVRPSSPSRWSWSGARPSHQDKSGGQSLEFSKVSWFHGIFLLVRERKIFVFPQICTTCFPRNPSHLWTSQTSVFPVVLWALFIKKSLLLFFSQGQHWSLPLSVLILLNTIELYGKIGALAGWDLPKLENLHMNVKKKGPNTKELQ